MSYINLRSLTPKVYDRVGELFRLKYGSYAGWAHSLLFAAELPMFSKLLPQNVCNSHYFFDIYSYIYQQRRPQSVKKHFQLEKKTTTKKSIF